MEYVLQAKKKIAEKRIQGCMLIVKFKKYNRLDKLRLAARREILQKDKLQADSNRLKLQNLFYEDEHLKKEINKCFSFKSEDEDIELVSLDEFNADAPESIRAEEILKDDHELRKARLNYELQQRKEYSLQCKDLEREKEEIAKKTIEVKKNLDSLYPCLQEIKKATRPIQQILNMPFEKEWEIQKLIALLPQPLYMAYTKLVAYSEVIDKNLTVSIEGDEDEARASDLQRKLIKEENSDVDDSDNELDENEFDDGNRRKLKRRQSQIESLKRKRAQLFDHHPLSVQFNIQMKNSQDVLSIALNYLPSLEFVTVQGKFNIESNGSIAAGDVITQDRILSSLYANDYGTESPSTKTIFQLQNLQLNLNDLQKELDDKKLGKPYKWAQKLCGISFTSDLSFKEAQNMCVETLPDLIREIRKKLKARMSLYKQLKALENGRLDIVSNIRISCILQLFVSLAYNDYADEVCTKRFMQHNLVHECDVFYRAIITRGSAKLECYICIPSAFPNESPIFAINLCWNDFKRNADNSAQIREMEHLINNEISQNLDEVISRQLHRAMTLFDIFLETECMQQSDDKNREFTQEKNFSRCFKGVERSRPFEAKTNSNLTSFTHY
jgi:THO complex subunit 5